jgi:transcriptional regulator with XRE-family HTH domain
VLPLAAAVRVLKARLDRTGQPLAGVARRIGVNRTTLSRMLYGESWPAWDLVTRMAAELEAPEALDAVRDALPPLD